MASFPLPSSSISTTNSAPLPIRRLDEALINRIAAGEIIHRPASALKELIENSLDARSTAIKVTVKDGGMKMLVIQDNGCGIRRDDLPILAERFTTSKLSTFSDLAHLTTYGFRGEALASISHVARLSVVTKTKEDKCAWKACYADGALAPQKAGQNADPKPLAGNDGTLITIEDLFYNTPTRLSALRSSAEEYARILDVLTKYAVHNPSVSFSCKKAAQPSVDLSTPSGSDVKQTIGLLYGHSIAKELLHARTATKKAKKTLTDDSMTVDKSASVNNASDDDELQELDSDDPESWFAEVFFTNANHQGKKTVFLLFINHRLVESARIKRALEGVYTGILPKGASPFIYLSLHIDPRSVDVNVHPTKREVHFLNEEAITEQIADVVSSQLVAQSQSRSFRYQTLLTGGVEEDGEDRSKIRKGKEKEIGNQNEDDRPESAGGSNHITATDFRKKTLSQHKVRTSLQDRTLDSMFPVANPARIDSSGGDGKSTMDENANVASSSAVAPRKHKEIARSDCYLTSVGGLRARIGKGKHKYLTEILEKHTFVGIVDLDRCLSLIQHSTKLYLVNHAALAEELFYQLGLRQFGDLPQLKLEPPPPLRMLVKLAVDAEDSTVNSKLSKAEIVDCIVKTLLTRREMLAEYFSLKLSSNGLVESLPLLLRDFTPNLDKLPSFLMRLGPQVDWTSETECFDSFFRELAYFYVPGPLLSAKTEDTHGQKAVDDAERWQITHVLFPAMRRYLTAPKNLLDRDVVQIANLPDLYRVFERC